MRENYVLDKLSKLEKQIVATYYCCSKSGTITTHKVSAKEFLFNACGLDTPGCGSSTHVASGFLTLSPSQLERIKCECKKNKK